MQVANPGLVWDYQLINVDDFNGRGESTPSAYFYQNLGEAEYVVAFYQYLRLCGYPSSKITILSTYNGQKHLLRDVLAQRCGPYPFFGMPARVTTVDRYQGQQNDIVLLSLVRTRAVGHVRDVRRLVVALSRARLGLYVFCRQSLFENCYELSPAFNLLLSRPPVLELVVGERYQGGSGRRPGDYPGGDKLVRVEGGVVQMGVIVQHLVSQSSQHFSRVQAALGPTTTTTKSSGGGGEAADGGAAQMEVERTQEQQNGDGEESSSSEEE